jgi:Tol biopolymer transport system component
LDLRTGLRNQSSNSGLALVRARGWDIAVIPFDGEQRYFRTEEARQLLAFGQSGRSVVWQNRASFVDPSEYIINSIDGKRLGTIQRLAASEFYPLDVNESSGRITFSGRLQGKEMPRGLYWASFDFVQRSFVGEAENCDWAPDGNALTCETEGHIWLFDIRSNSSRPLTLGHTPTWSPDGTSIAYRTPDGRASLMNSNGAPMKWPLGMHESTGALRWSPDGRYVSFIEPIREGIQIPLITADYRLLVCRVNDGKSVTVGKFGSYAGPPDFHWIIDYRKFCGDCMPGQAFN